MKYVSQIDANKPREEGRTEKEGRGEKRESVGGREAEIDAELGSMGRGGRRTMHVILEMRGQFQAAKINGTANGAGKSKCKLANGEEWPAVSSIPLRGLGTALAIRIHNSAFTPSPSNIILIYVRSRAVRVRALSSHYACLPKHRKHTSVALMPTDGRKNGIG